MEVERKNSIEIQLEHQPDETVELEGGQENQLPDSVGSDVKRKTKSGLKGFTTGFKNMIPSSAGRQGNEETTDNGTEAGTEAESKTTSGLKSLTAGLKNPFAGISRRNETTDVEADVEPEETGIEAGSKAKSRMAGFKNPFAGIGRQNETTEPEADTEAGKDVGSPGRPGRLSRMVSGITPSSPQPDDDDNESGNTPIPVPLKTPKVNKQEAEQTISNGFNTKKTLANGLMDFAFLTANANQLHYAITSRRVVEDERIASIVLISSSIFFQNQLIVGILLIVKSYIQSKPFNELNQPERLVVQHNIRLHRLNLIDHITITLVFLIAILNIFIASFSIAPENVDNVTTTTTTPNSIL